MASGAARRDWSRSGAGGLICETVDTQRGVSLRRLTATGGVMHFLSLTEAGLDTDAVVQGGGELAPVGTVTLVILRAERLSRAERHEAAARGVAEVDAQVDQLEVVLLRRVSGGHGAADEHGLQAERQCRERGVTGGGGRTGDDV